MARDKRPRGPRVREARKARALKIQYQYKRTRTSLSPGSSFEFQIKFYFAVSGEAGMEAMGTRRSTCAVVWSFPGFQHSAGTTRSGSTATVSAFSRSHLERSIAAHSCAHFLRASRSPHQLSAL